MLHHIDFQFLVCRSHHFACVCMRSDVFVCVVGLSHKLISFLSEGFAESMLNVHKKVFICKTT